MRIAHDQFAFVVNKLLAQWYIMSPIFYAKISAEEICM